MTIVNTTSFAKTPQATDDSYYFSESNFQNLSNPNILTLDVLANDLGGKAKVLYSLDDGGSTLSEILQGLVQSDIGKEVAGTTQKGATLQIVDGRVQIDLSPVFAASKTLTSMDALGEGEKFVDTFTYAIRLANGTLSWATVSYTITGTNDEPVVTGTVTGGAMEDGAAITLDALGKASDVDHGTVLQVVNLPERLPAGVSYDPAKKAFTLNPSHDAYQSLGEGQSKVVTVTYGVSDGMATKEAAVSWTIAGTNDAPKVATALTETATEDGSVSTVKALTGASDVDAGDTLEVKVDLNNLPAGVTYDADSQSFKLDPKVDSFQSLAAGETTKVVVSYGISDGKATTAQTLTWTVTGTNDVPKVAAILKETATEDGSISTVNALAGATDVDLKDTLTVVDVPAADELPAGVTYDAATKIFTLDPTVPAYQSLAKGETMPVTVSYSISDGTATIPQSVTWTVMGTNDAPQVAGPLTGTATEDGTLSTVNALTGASDVDLKDTLTVVDVPGADELPAGVTYDAATKTFTLDPTVQAYQSLAKGETMPVTVSYSISDGTATIPQSVTWTVTGTNDAPKVTAALKGTATEDGMVSTVNALTGATDVDVKDTLTVVDVPGADKLPAGVTYDEVTKTFTLDPTVQAYQSLAKGETMPVTVSYSISDGTATIPQSVTWTVMGTNDAPQVAGPLTGTATEDGTLSTVNALTGASDVDLKDTLTVVDVPGADKLPAGVTYDAATKTFTLDPTVQAYQWLAKGETTTVKVSYGISDGTDTIPQSVTWTITGTNDAPVVSGAVTGAATEDGTGVTLNALANASDVDTGAKLSVVNVPGTLPDGVTYSEVDNTFTLDPHHKSYQSLAQGQTDTVTVSYDVSDGMVTTPASVSWTITGANDAPVVSGAVTGTATEDGSGVTLYALANASDVDMGAKLSVVNVPTKLPDGVTYSEADNTFTLDPHHKTYQSLAQGQTDIVTVSYGVSDGMVTTPASVSWTITGTNDAPVVSGAVTGTATEDGSGATLNALANASDVDTGAVLSVVNVPTKLPDGVTYNEADNTFSLDPNHKTYQSLAQGQTDTVTVSYGVSDGMVTTPASVSWTITGTNDAPDVKAALAGAATEDGSVSTVDALMAATDVDANDTLSVVDVPAKADLPAGVTYDSASQSFTLDPKVDAYQSLAAGKTAEVVVSYGISDGKATTAQTITWTVTGTNDAPTVAVALTATATEDGSISTVSALAGASDVDVGDKLSVVQVPATADLPDGVSYDAASQSFRLDPSADAYQSLAEGVEKKVTVSYGISDGTATTPQTITWTVTGVNGAPVVTGAVTGQAQEDSTPVTLSALANASDEDAGSTLEVVDIQPQLPAGVSYDPATKSFTLNPSAQAYQSLPAGQTTTVTVNYKVSDGTAATPASMSWTVTGVNDPTTFGGAMTGTVYEDGTLTTGGTLTVADADANEAVFSSTGSLAGTYGTFTFNTSSGAWTYALNNTAPNVQALAAGQTVTDSLLVTTAGNSQQNIVVSIQGAQEPVNTMVANNDLVYVTNNTKGITIPVSALLGNDVNASGAVLSLGSLSGTTPLSNLKYTPGPDGGSISFDYAGNSQFAGQVFFNYTLTKNGTSSTGQVELIAKDSNNDTNHIELTGTYAASYLDMQKGGDTASSTGTGMDTFLGGDGQDMLTGGTGNDRLSGGANNDTLDGGGGSDTFVFDVALKDMGTDSLISFDASNPSLERDFIELSASIFSGITAASDPAGTLLASQFVSVANLSAGGYDNLQAKIVYDQQTGNLYYDKDGSKDGMKDATLVATLLNKPTDLDASDFKVV